MIFSNLRHDNWWSRDNFSNQLQTLMKLDLIIISLFVDLLLLHFNIFFLNRCANILDVYIYI
jgi:hypothetical protein